MHRIALFACLLFSAPAWATTPSGVPADPMVAALRNITYYEDYLQPHLSVFRQYAGEHTSFTRADIERARARELATARAALLQQIMQADLDADGRVTRKEADEHLGRRSGQRAGLVIPHPYVHPGNDWFVYDTNKDDVLTIDEIRLATPAMSSSRHDAAETLFAFDADRNGTLTLEEVRSGAKAVFDRYDTDRDGILSETEKLPLFPGITARPEPVTKAVAPIAMAKDAELHVVGVYEGMRGANTVPVKLDRGSKKVALILLSYERVRWDITAGKTPISEIYVATHGEAPSEVRVNGNLYEKATQVPVRYSYVAHGVNFRALLSYIKAATGRDGIASFHGAYASPPEGFTVASVSDDPELRNARLQPVGKRGLPRVSLPLSLKKGPGLYNLSGELQEPLAPALLKAAYVPSEKSYYAYNGGGLQRLDANGKPVESILLSLDVPAFSHPSDITYNPATHSIVVVSFGGEGHLYRYDLKKKRWSATSLNNKDYRSFRYDPASGNYLATTMHERFALVEVDGNGAVVRTLPLDLSTLPGARDFYDEGNAEPNVSVLPLKDYLVIAVSAGHHAMGFDGTAALLYLRDRASGKTVLTYMAE